MGTERELGIVGELNTSTGCCYSTEAELCLCHFNISNSKLCYSISVSRQHLVSFTSKQRLTIGASQ